MSYMLSFTRFILGPLLFLLDVNNLPNNSKILDAIMFANDTNLFFSKCDIPLLFATVISELSKKLFNIRCKINHWFLANKLSLNVTKTKYSLFHKTSKKDDIPLKLSRLQINNYNIEMILSITS